MHCDSRGRCASTPGDRGDVFATPNGIRGVEGFDQLQIKERDVILLRFVASCSWQL